MLSAYVLVSEKQWDEVVRLGIFAKEALSIAFESTCPEDKDITVKASEIYLELLTNEIEELKRELALLENKSNCDGS